MRFDNMLTSSPRLKLEQVRRGRGSGLRPRHPVPPGCSVLSAGPTTWQVASPHFPACVRPGDCVCRTGTTTAAQGRRCGGSRSWAAGGRAPRTSRGGRSLLLLAVGRVGRTCAHVGRARRARPSATGRHAARGSPAPRRGRRRRCRMRAPEPARRRVGPRRAAPRQQARR
eukprot:gene6312-biopygen7342